MEKNSNPITRLISVFWHKPLLLAFLMSSSLLAGAIGFQYIGGLAPCDLCWSQRYAHMAILALSGAAPMLKNTGKAVQNTLVWATMLALDVSIAVSGYHAGIEQKWWKGPTTCTSDGLSQGVDMESLFDAMMEAKLVLCDEIPWEMFGISMAGYNFLISLATALFVTATVVNNLRQDHDKNQ